MAVKTIPVEVQRDHLEGLTRARTPLAAIAELVWNGLDADADEVRVEFEVNALGGVSRIWVRDNGHGIGFEEAPSAFGQLGGSWKRTATKTEGNRLLHGKLGKGRFRAFSLGEVVRWVTRFSSDARGLLAYEIVGRASNLKEVAISDPAPVTSQSGTDVEIDQLVKLSPSPLSERAGQQLTETIALYLFEYPSVRVLYDGKRLDPASVVTRKEAFDLGQISAQDGLMMEATLTVVEWQKPTERALYFCDESGFTLWQTTPGIQAPGFNFTAYVSSPYCRELERADRFSLGDLDPDFKALSDAAKAKLREYFRGRAAEAASDLIAEWKKEDVYPFHGEPENPVEQATRQVFDVLAINVHAYHPDLQTAATKSKKLTFGLLRHAVESGPSALQQILQEVLGLPKSKQEELAELLAKTSLDAVIGAASVVASRLEFLKALEALVFDTDKRGILLERRHLHRLLANNTWVFGERFNLSVNDEGLTKALAKHLEGRELEFHNLEPVKTTEGAEARLDLMLSRGIPQSRPGELEHLVVELKRPIVKAGAEELSQVEKYAVAVAADERFRDVQTTWNFWLVVNDMDEFARKKAKQRKREQGLIYEDDDGRIFVWVKSWAQIIEECRARLKFFAEKLSYSPSTSEALEYLRKTSPQFLPVALRGGELETQVVEPTAGP